MKRRGFLRLLAMAPLVAFIKPSKKKRRAVISDEDVINQHFEMIEKAQEKAIADILSEEDRQIFALMRKAA